MKRKTALAVGLGVLLLVTVALAYELWLCPTCGHTMTAYYTCANHIPPIWFEAPAYISPDNPPPPPMDWPCPLCHTPCDADSVVCDSCGWSWHR
jgi:hypothetical protein